MSAVYAVILCPHDSAPFMILQTRDKTKALDTMRQQARQHGVWFESDTRVSWYTYNEAVTACPTPSMRAS